MKFNTISYERSKGDSYNRQSLKIEITMSESQDEDALLDWLKARVEADLGIHQEKLEKSISKLQQQKHELEREKEDLERQITEAKNLWGKTQAFLSKHGVSVPSDSNETPF